MSDTSLGTARPLSSAPATTAFLGLPELLLAPLIQFLGPCTVGVGRTFRLGDWHAYPSRSSKNFCDSVARLCLISPVLKLPSPLIFRTDGVLQLVGHRLHKFRKHSEDIARSSRYSCAAWSLRDPPCRSWFVTSWAVAISPSLNFRDFVFCYFIKNRHITIFSLS